MRMICIFCNRTITPKENYHKNVEMNEGHEVKTDYYHQTCWHSFTNQMRNADSSLKKSNYLLKSLGNYMGKMGMLEEDKEEVVII